MTRCPSCLVFTAASLVAVALSAAQVPRASWTPLASGVTATLRGVSVVSDDVAWASGGRGTVIRTTDGGDTWRALTVPGGEALDFRDVDAVDARTAYLMSIGNGPASRIYKTTDGGATWTRQFQNEEADAFFDAMAFSDAAHGVAVSDSVAGQFVILTTSNGGDNWTRVPADRLPAALSNEGYFAASGTNVTTFGRTHIWAGTGAAARARVLRSTDAGATWQIADTPLPAGQSAGIYSIAFRDAMNGVVVGGDYAKETEQSHNIAVTRDGGATWTRVTRADGTPALGGFRSAVAYVRGTTTWIAVGPSGTDISHDDGRTWAPVEGPGFHAFSLAPSGRVGFGAGGRGAVGRLSLRMVGLRNED